MFMVNVNYNKTGVDKMERYLSNEFINSNGGVSFAIANITRDAVNGDVIYVGDDAQKATAETYLIAENKKEISIQVNPDINSYNWMEFTPT